MLHSVLGIFRLYLIAVQRNYLKLQFRESVTCGDDLASRHIHVLSTRAKKFSNNSVFLQLLAMRTSEKVFATPHIENSYLVICYDDAAKIRA